MSFVAYNWAKVQKIRNQAQKSVLLALADFADKDGFAWPAQETLAERTGLSSRTVRSALKALEAGGFIAREKRNRRFDRGRSSDLILMGIAVETENKSARPTGRSRPTYRKEFPGNLSGNVSKDPSQVENYTYQDIALGEEFDPASNVVPFPIERDAA